MESISTRGLFFSFILIKYVSDKQHQVRFNNLTYTGTKQVEQILSVPALNLYNSRRVFSRFELL